MKNTFLLIVTLLLNIMTYTMQTCIDLNEELEKVLTDADTAINPYYQGPLKFDTPNFTLFQEKLDQAQEFFSQGVLSADDYVFDSFNLEISDRTLLYEFISNPGIVRFLIEHGADVNKISLKNVTPLHKIIRLTKSLPKEAGSDNQRSKKIFNNLYQSTHLLLENGAHINAQNLQGNTPLMHLLDETDLYSMPEVLTLTQLILSKQGLDQKTKDFVINNRQKTSYFALLPTDFCTSFMHNCIGQSVDLSLKNNEGKTIFDIAFNTERQFNYAQAHYFGDVQMFRAKFKDIIALLKTNLTKSEQEELQRGH